MKTVRIMSIIGIVWSSLSLVCVLAFFNSNISGSAGWGFMGLLYALPFSIVVLVHANKIPVSTEGDLSDLIRLNELREKNVITEAEFNAKKSQILKYL